MTKTSPIEVSIQPGKDGAASALSSARASASRRPPSAWRSSFNLWAGGAVVGLVVFCALFAPWLAPHRPDEQNLLNLFAPPMWLAGGDSHFPLGTDNLGRDVLSRLLYGSRIALGVAISSAFLAGVFGSVLAVLAGYLGGRVDRAVTFLVDLWMSFPPVVLSLVLMVSLGAGLQNVILSIVLVDWTRFCRVIRAEVLVVRQRDYVLAAQLLNLSHRRIVLREVVPAVLPLLITLFSLEMGVAIAVEALLSFIGLSVPANVTAWGVMIADARVSMHDSMTGLLFPVLAIVITVLGCNLLGDGLRTRLDPRLRRNGE